MPHAVDRTIEIYRALKAAAAAGEPAPSASDLAERFGCSRQLVGNALHLLESTAMIQRRRGVVTIRETGDSTAAPKPKEKSMTKRRHSTIQFNPTEWLADTARMPRLVRSVLHDLCCYTWERGAAVPPSEVFLMLADLPEGQGEAIIANLVSGGHLEQMPDGSVFSGKALTEAQRAYMMWEARSRGGRGGGPAPVEEPARDDLDLVQDADEARALLEATVGAMIDARPVGAPEIAEAWNRLAAARGLKSIKRMTQERIDRLHARIAEHGAEAIIAAVERLADNEIVLATKPTFDALLNPETCARMIHAEDEPEDSACG